MRSNLIIHVESVIDSAESTSTKINGDWIPARPCGYCGFFYRVKAAWGVFTGKYDALKWGGGQ